MFKRRPLGQKRQGNSGGFSQATGGLRSNDTHDAHAEAQAQYHQQQSQGQPQGPQPTKENQPQRGQQGRRKRKGQPNQNQGQNQNQRQSGQRQGQPNQNQNQRNQGQRGPQRGQPNQQRQNRPPQPQQRRAPPPPPAYVQRDVLLVLSAQNTEGIETVRAKFDPLAKKLPAHVTLLFPEPALHISKEFLKDFQREDLPALESLTFSNVIVHDEMYLWLLPDDEGKQKVSLWREALLKKLSSHNQNEEFVPHLTLGYVPRSMTPEDAVAFVKNHVALPLTLPLEKVLLEEFTENQNSTSLDSLALKIDVAP